MIFRRALPNVTQFLLLLGWMAGSLLLAEANTTTNNPFLDVYLRIHPADDFCGARRCNISYAISVLHAQNQFDLQSLMLQDGSMTRNERYFFEDNTVIRLTHELRTLGGKIYLGLMLFDVPSDIQNYVVVEVTDVIRHEDRRVKTEFSSETVRIGIHVYKRSEAILDDDEDATTNSNYTLEGNSTSSNNEPSSFASLSTNTIQSNGNGGGCSCVKGSCGCCEHASIAKIHLNDTACINVTYVSEDIGIRMVLEVDDHIYYSKEVSVRNPPPVCYEVPHLREYASLCMRLYNVEVTREYFAACSELEAKLYHVRVARQKIGCFRIPL